MSVFRRGVKLQNGALPDELGSSSSEEDDDDEVSEQEEGEEESGEEQEDGEEEEEEDDDEEVNLGWKFEPKKPAEKKQGGEGGEDAGSEGDEEGEEGSEGDEEVVDDGTVAFPVTCQICEKVMFNQQSADLHLKSKQHLKNEKRFEQQEKSSKRTPEQIAKLRLRNRAKKERKMQRKNAESSHVWGEHKLPPKKPSVKKVQGEQAPARKRKAEADADEVGLEAALLPKKQVKKALSGGGGADKPAGKGMHPVGEGKAQGKGKAQPPQKGKGKGQPQEKERIRDKADGGSAGFKRKGKSK